MYQKFTILFFSFFLFIKNLSSQEQNSISSNFHFGFEISELMQNDFSNLGKKNYTFFFGQEFRSEILKNFGYRILLINVELSPRHLRDNTFIKGDKWNLEGNLSVGRIFLDYLHSTSSFGFVSFQPIFSIGFGYNRNQVQQGKFSQTIRLLQSETFLDYYRLNLTRKYDLQGYTFDLGFRLQTRFWNSFFIEFPVIDVFTYLWINRNIRGNLETTRLNYPNWGMLFLWFNFGYTNRW